MPNKLLLTLILVGMVAFPSASFSQTAITDANWQNHPQITAIRSIVMEVDSLLKKGSLSHKEGGVEYQPGKDGTRESYTDSNGVIRKFVRDGGSDDSAATLSYYYDAKGHLRFVYIVAGAVNGTHIQHRIYLDESGKKIWEIQKLIEGPGYTFPEEWPIEEMMFEPSKIPMENW